MIRFSLRLTGALLALALLGSNAANAQTAPLPSGSFTPAQPPAELRELGDRLQQHAAAQLLHLASEKLMRASQAPQQKKKNFYHPGGRLVEGGVQPSGASATLCTSYH
jgi:hypothetical protein